MYEDDDWTNSELIAVGVAMAVLFLMILFI
jgi:hypothetical protein